MIELPDFTKSFEYENNFYLTCDITRISKIIAQYEIFKMVQDIPGAIVECGVFKGASFSRFSMFREILSNPFGKKIIGFDTFEGFPYDDKYSLDIHKKGLSAGFEYEHIIKKIKQYEVDDKIILVKGMFEETLYQQLKEHKFSFVFVDCNLYDSTKFGLEFAYPRMPKNAIIAFD